MTKLINFKPFFTSIVFWILTAIPLGLWLGKTVGLTYAITGIISPFIILFMYWLTGEM
jgi:hypothetical protein